MSRIGKKPIPLPRGVKMMQEGRTVKVEGPKGNLSLVLPPGIEVVEDQGILKVNRMNEERQTDAYQGLTRTLVGNMVAGVSTGFEKTLNISGVGYRAEVAGGKLKMVIGYSVPVEYPIPPQVQIKVDKQVNITVSGIDREVVGRVAAEIRELKSPEPYKGKGIKYANEVIRRKVGKSAGSKK
jgi:large subunit ribosomal protein L6